MRPRSVKFGLHRIAVADDQPTFWNRVEAGLWEPGTLAALDRLVDQRTTFLDIGAWTGPTTLYAANRADRVLAVEADPAALDQLHRNLAVNPDLASRIEVVERAAAPTQGRVRLGAKRKAGDSMSSVLLASGERTWDAQAVTPPELADLVAPGKRLVVKMDVEGAEYGLLPAAGPLISRADAVLVSFHPKLARAALGDAGLRRATRAALRALKELTAYRVTPEGLARSFEPGMLRLGLLPSLTGHDWAFLR